VEFLGLRGVWVPLSLSAFEKIKCIFSIASMGNLADELRGGTGRWPLAFGVLSGVAECTGHTGVSPLLSDRCAGILRTSLGMNPVSTGRSDAQRQVTPRFCIPP